MAKQQLLNLTQKLRTKTVAIVNADGTTLKTVYTASQDDAIVKTLQVISNDTVARILDVYLNVGGVDYPIGSVNIPVGAGTASGTTVAVDLLNGAILAGLPYDATGKRVLPLEATVILKVATEVAVTAGKQITVLAGVEEY